MNRYELALYISSSNSDVNKVVQSVQAVNARLYEELENNNIDLNTFILCVIKHTPFLVNVFKTENYKARLIDKSYIKRQVKKLADKIKLSEMTRRLKKMILKTKRDALRKVITEHECNKRIKYLRTVNKYANEHITHERAMQNKRNDEFLQSQVIKDRNGNTFNLGSLDDQIRKRFNEYYMQVKAMELKAENENKRWMFLTLTCPPRMHPNPKLGKNSYDGTSISDAVKFINERWTAATKDLSKKGISVKKGEIFGFKIIEPHQDGCPHLHALIFIDNENIRTVLEEFVKAFDYRNDFIDEQRQRVKDYNNKIDKLEARLFSKFAKAKTASITAILNIEEDKQFNNKTKKKASAATYVTKYLMKNANSTKINENGAKLLDESTTERVDAWRSCAKARAFATIGFRGVITKWRQIRKIDNEDVLKLRGKALQLVLLAKGAKIVKLKSVSQLRAYEGSEMLLAKDKNKLLVRSYNKAHEHMLAFAEMLLNEEVETSNVKEAYINKYEETVYKTVGIKVNKSKLMKKEVIILKSNTFEGGSGLILHYPSSTSLRDDAVCKNEQRAQKVLKNLKETEDEYIYDKTSNEIYKNHKYIKKEKREVLEVIFKDI